MARPTKALRCIDFAKGEVKWADRVSELRQFVMPMAIYICTAKTAILALVDATPEGYHEKGQIHAARPAGPRHRPKPGPIR